MVGIDGSVVAVANPYIGKDLHASLADLQWVTNAYLLVIAALLILGGKLGDRFGRRRVFLIGVVGFSLTSVAIGLVGTIDGVILLRGIQGAFGALLLPNTLALLKAAFPPEELNRAVGIWVSASAAATAAGPIIGGIFVEHISWQSVFFINLPGRSRRARRRSARPERDQGIGTAALRHPRGAHPRPRTAGHRLRPGQRAELGLGSVEHARHHRDRASSSLSFSSSSRAGCTTHCAARHLSRARGLGEHRHRAVGFLRPVRRVVLHLSLPAERARIQPGRRRPAPPPPHDHLRVRGTTRRAPGQPIRALAAHHLRPAGLLRWPSSPSSPSRWTPRTSISGPRSSCWASASGWS